MDVSTNRTAKDARQAREIEYGTYVAAESITVGGALAFNPGDPVPVSTVKKFNLSSAVRRVNAEPAKSADKPEK